MNYRVPLYQLVEKGEEQVGTVVVQNTSLGAVEITTGAKIHVSTGALSILPTLYQMKTLSPFVKKSDFNAQNLVRPNNYEKAMKKVMRKK